MKAALYDTKVTHVRPGDPPYSFTHKMYLWFVDLAEMPKLPWWLRPFSRFDARDHFEKSNPADIRSKLDGWLATRGINLDGGQVLMLTSARVLGYVFNPITLYWCYRGDALACVVAEVHNTYHGRHAYLLHTNNKAEAWADKEFYVSPFQPMEGEYRMRLPKPEDLLSVTVALQHGERNVLTATLHGTRRPATISGILRMVTTRPIVPQRVSALIRKHGIVLWVRRAAITPRTAQSVGGEFHG